MPYKTEWVPPEMAFILKDGRPVYHTYKDNDCNNGRMRYWYTISDDPEDEEAGKYDVDVRDYPSCGSENHQEILQNAVDRGLIWPPGTPEPR